VLRVSAMKGGTKEDGASDIGEDARVVILAQTSSHKGSFKHDTPQTMADENDWGPFSFLYDG
jgi:hypothetical protein